MGFAEPETLLYTIQDAVIGGKAPRSDHSNPAEMDQDGPNEAKDQSLHGPSDLAIYQG